MKGRCLPDYASVRTEVAVCQPVTHAADIGPGYLRCQCLEFCREILGTFAENNQIHRGCGNAGPIFDPLFDGSTIDLVGDFIDRAQHFFKKQ